MLDETCFLTNSFNKKGFSICQNRVELVTKLFAGQCFAIFNESCTNEKYKDFSPVKAKSVQLSEREQLNVSK